VNRLQRFCTSIAKTAFTYRIGLRYIPLQIGAGLLFLLAMAAMVAGILAFGAVVGATMAKLGTPGIIIVTICGVIGLIGIGLLMWFILWLQRAAHGRTSDPWDES